MKKIFYLLTLIAFFPFAYGQTVLINPATDGGFENGTTFAANGWTAVNAGTNNWHCGSSTAGSPLANWWTGSNGAYVSDNGGANWQYNGTINQRSHIYKDIAFPAGQSNITLTYDIRMFGEAFYDNLQVYITDTSITPNNAGPTSSNTTTTGWPGYTNGTTGYFLLNSNAISNTTTTTVTFNFTEAQGLFCAGSTKRLIFTWKNNTTNTTQAPVSIDNISLTSVTPPTNNSCTTPTSLTVNPSEVCSTFTSGTTVNANNAGLAGCSGNADDDVWYSFVATSSTHNVTVTAGTIQNVVFQVFQGNCNGLSNIGCINNTAGSGSESFNLNGLTPGNTYLVRVYSFDGTTSSRGTFDICVTSPPVGCATKAPDDVAILCNETAILTAASSQVSYSMMATPCDPIAITGTNAFPVPADDAVTGQIPIGFDFNFYGNVYNTAVIQTNGIVGFGPFTFTGFSPFSIPALTAPNNYIAGIFADIDIRFGGTITYATIGTAPNRQFVVNYSNVVPYNGGSSAGTGTASFQIVLNENGSFNIIISQFSANWYSSISTSLATSGSENIDGTIAFPVPLRNSTDWPGIVPTNRDCHTFVSSACTFVRWQEGATVLTTNPVLNVSPTTTTPYTAVWNCGGNECSDETIVTVLPSSIIKSNVIDNTNCVFPNGIINLVTDNLNAPSYTVNYLQNGTPASQTINLTSQNIAPGDTFNSGVLTNTDPKWTRNNAGSVCNASAVPSQFFDVYSFTVTANGLYAFDMCNGATSFNGFASLYQNAFNINNPCDIAANHIISDDNGNPNAGVCDNDARISASLVTGVTYYLVTTTNFSNTTGDYNWTFVSGPGNIVNNDSYYQLTNLSAGTYTDFSITTNCGNVTFPGPIVLGDISQRTWLGTTSNDWNNPVNWSNGLIPNAFNCVVIPVTANNPVVSGVNYNAFAYSLTVLDGASLIVNSSNTIVVTDVVTVNPTGSFNIQNDASLVQINDVANIGTIVKNKEANIKRLDYVYWSSPVANFSSSAISPLTPSNRIYKWEPTTVTGYASNFGNWVSGNETMQIGKGYIVRGPDNFTDTNQIFTSTITGVPNNGNITTPIFRSNYDGISYTGPTATLVTKEDDNWNLIGNPYPSAIDAISFLNSNTNIDGFVKIWTHGTAPSTGLPNPFYQSYTYNYNVNDYIAYNATGASSGPASFNGKIASGQGFFVLMNHTSASDAESVSFTNALRRDGLGLPYSNDEFFRTAQVVDQSGKIWLDIIAPNNNTTRTLVGYLDGASNNRDRLFDAIANEKLDLNLYSLTDNIKMTIQGRTLPFDVTDRVSLGVKIPESGIYSIAIGELTGFMTTQAIYLEDTDLGIIHDLVAQPYSFTASSGDFSNRFVLRYDNETLGNDDFDNANNEVFAVSNDILSVQSTNLQLQSVKVFDITGRLLSNYNNIGSKSIILQNIQKNNAPLVIQIELENGLSVNKKVIF